MLSNLDIISFLLIYEKSKISLHRSIQIFLDLFFVPVFCVNCEHLYAQLCHCPVRWIPIRIHLTTIWSHSKHLNERVHLLIFNKLATKKTKNKVSLFSYELLSADWWVKCSILSILNEACKK